MTTTGPDPEQVYATLRMAPPNPSILLSAWQECRRVLGRTRRSVGGLLMRA